MSEQPGADLWWGLLRGPDVFRKVLVQPNIPVAVVDDDASVRYALENLLSSAGFVTTLFESAEEFLASADRRNTFCLILDLRLPGMSGLDLQQRLRELGATIPVIFISGHGDEDAQGLALQGGAVAFLQKPFTDRSLLEAIKSIGGA
jgi:two-component system, LuxR family, response regulator FixJ